MVHFRLTRAQRAAAHSTAIASHTSRNRDIATAASTAASTRPADEAPYYQIESSINQFAGNTASSSGSPAFGVEVEAVDTGIGNTDSGNLDSSVEENIASTFGNISAVASASSHQNDIASGGTTPDSRSTRAKKSVGDDSNSGSSSSSAKRRVLRLLDSPRRKILGRMSGNSAATSSGSSTVGAQGSGLTLSAGIAAASPAPSQSSPSTPRVGAGRSRLLQVMPQPIATSNGEMSGKSDDDNEDNEPPSPLSSSSHTIYPVQETSSSLLTSSPILTLKKSSKPNGLPPPTTVQSKFADPSNILEWLHDEAPDDILPRVLSFDGSRRIATLSLASKSWRRMCLSETVWQTACEDTGKYRPGIDLPLQPTVTWLQHYRDNPLVPVDYDTIQRAMYKADVCAMDAEDGSNRHPTVPQHQRSLRVLLKPKTYVLKEALVVHALGRAEVTIETVDGPSARGLVTIDGGRATVTNSHVHHCAATGIYIGGPSSRAIIRGTDVVQNGYGNKRNTRRGITRGHSGVYLEQGTANLRDCNVSNNALTGISAVSADNALLDVRDTDLMSNETMQLEMPPAGSRSCRRSISRDNRIVQEGTSRSRSGLVPPEDAVVSSPNTLYNGIVGEGNSSSRRRRRREHEGLPQSPASDGDDGEQQQQQVGSPH